MGKGFCPTQAPGSEDGKEASSTDALFEPGHRYHELIWSLLYIASITRPDIAQWVSVLSRYINAPTTTQYYAIIRVSKYLHSTKDKALNLGGNSKVILEGYVGADCAGDLDNRYSTSSQF